MKWLADENLRNAIVRGLLRNSASFDIVRAQDVRGVCGHDDQTLLTFATLENRIVVTHDVSTMLGAMRELLRTTSSCSPIVLVPDFLPVQSVVEDILLLDQCATESDWVAGILHLPLR